MAKPDNLRRPPAFQEYGADLLNLEAVKLMSLGERGLLATMRWCIWANDTLPADPAQLARLLGISEEEVRRNLTEAVLGFFRSAAAKGYGDRLECPELLDQMARLAARREAQVKSAEVTNANRYGNRDGNRRADRLGSEKSRTEKSGKLSAVDQGNTSEKEAA